ncbi:MAG: L,D-transpeptidase family protein [Rhodospirillales bacterium]|nr:L,D-transpeptidase family protein [Rhodospirillales bacterium]
MTDENVLIVQADTAEGSLGWATLGERRWRCAVGAGGIREDKVEGDAATPVGEFPLRRIYYRNDLLVLPKPNSPKSALPARPIGEHDGWCDDPRSPSYNRLVHIPNEWSAEKMWREDGLYDLVVVVGYNDDPPEGEWGSAIFLHIARDDYAATQGCVAFARDDLMELLPLLSRETRLRVLSHSAAEEAPPPSDDDARAKQFEDFDEKDW